jgi:hypothetical protein
VIAARILAEVGALARFVIKDKFASYREHRPDRHLVRRFAAKRSLPWILLLPERVADNQFRAIGDKALPAEWAGTLGEGCWARVSRCTLRS